MEFIFEIIMELLPTLFVETIFEKIYNFLKFRVHNKFLKILIISIVMLISVVLAIGSALAILFALGLILFKLKLL